MEEEQTEQVEGDVAEESLQDWVESKDFSRNLFVSVKSKQIINQNTSKF
jgi:hypothetical protein